MIGPPDTLAGWVPLLAHTIENQSPVAATGSLNEIDTLEPSPTPVALSAGVVDSTVGAGSTVGRGVGVPAVKSAALSSVSVAPSSSRSAAVVLVRVGAAAGPSKQLAVP